MENIPARYQNSFGFAASFLEGYAPTADFEKDAKAVLKIKKQLEAVQKEMRKPLNDELRDINSVANPLLAELAKLEAEAKARGRAAKREKERLADEQAARELAQIAAARAKRDAEIEKAGGVENLDSVLLEAAARAEADLAAEEARVERERQEAGKLDGMSEVVRKIPVVKDFDAFLADVCRPAWRKESSPPWQIMLAAAQSAASAAFKAGYTPKGVVIEERREMRMKGSR